MVLAATSWLPLGEIRYIRQDLDLFSRAEAEYRVRRELDELHVDSQWIDDARMALKRLHDPVDEFLVRPFYLDLIVRLERAKQSFSMLPPHRDQWRQELLETYLLAVRGGMLKANESSFGADIREFRRRCRAADDAAQQVALLASPSCDLTVARDDDGLKAVTERAFDDARRLNLLWHGAEQVGFRDDDLGAYLIAGRLDDSADLRTRICEIATSDQAVTRRDRYVIAAAIFWHLRKADRPLGLVSPIS